MLANTMLVVVVSLTVALSFHAAEARIAMTMLEIDNAPCKPENLKKTTRYICDSYGNITCQHGWMESSPPDPQNPCLIPVCETGCDHGECRGPDLCACEIGWDGKSCSECVRLPGCEHGYCKEALSCYCEEDWTGAFCNEPICDSCDNGICTEPGECTCHVGWFGSNCSTCQALPGCQHGHCAGHPNSCVCEDGWTGALCDKPLCEAGCVNGQCVATETAGNMCICELGWRGTACDRCTPYHDCPAQTEDACQTPNQCICEPSISPLCKHELLYEEHQFGDFELF